MKVGYVVLYVNDADACRRFWVEQIGMVEKRRTEAGGFTIAQVGFADQPFAFELVPMELMRDNPDGLDLATPSIAFTVDDLEETHGKGAEWPLSRKFGCSVAMAEQVLARAHALGLNAYGVSFHVGSQQTRFKSWDEALAQVSRIFRSLGERGITLSMVNLGGGFP